MTRPALQEQIPLAILLLVWDAPFIVSPGFALRATKATGDGCAPESNFAGNTSQSIFGRWFSGGKL
jgi:hypothetical protein